MTPTTLPAMPNYGEPPITLTVRAPGLCCSTSGDTIAWDHPSPVTLTIARRIDRQIYVMAEAEPAPGRPRVFAACAADGPAAVANALATMADKIDAATTALEPIT